MKKVQTFQHTIGKRDDRNDDFVLTRRVLNTRVLGVLGDFTSDSPEGINQRLERELAEFIDTRIDTWRKALIDPRRIVSLVTRHINEWLSQRREKAKTTLIVVLYDAHEGCFHYVSIGDSCLAMAWPGGMNFLSKGDTSGNRDASGFLPLESEHLIIKRAETKANATVFACTDGLWENTGHLEEMTPERCEVFLADLFVGESRDLIAGAVQTGLINRCSRADDLSILLFKEEDMVDKNSKPEGDLPPDLMDAVDKRINEALDRGVQPAPITPASPMEREFLELLKATNDGIRHLEARLDQKIDNRTGNTNLERQIKELGQAVRSLNNGLESLSSKVEEQGSRIIGLEGAERRQKPRRQSDQPKTSIQAPPHQQTPAGKKDKKTKSKPAAQAPKPRSGPPRAPDYHPQGGEMGPSRPPAPGHDMVAPAPAQNESPEPKPTKTLAEQKESQTAPTTSQATTARQAHVDPVGGPHHHEDRALGNKGPVPLPMFLASVAFVIFAIWAGYKLTRSNRTLLDEVATKEQQVQMVEALLACPEGSLDRHLAEARPPADTEGYFTGIKTPAALLTVLSMDDWTFRAELVHLEKRMALVLEDLKQETSDRFKLELDDRVIRDQTSIELRIKYAKQVPWLSDLNAGNITRIPPRALFYIWLQVATNAKDKDGMWGKGTEQAVVDFINEAGTVNLIQDAEGLNGPDKLARVIRDTPDLMPTDWNFKQSVIEAFDIESDDYDSQLIGLAKTLQESRLGLETPFLHLRDTIGGQGYNMYVEYCRNSNATPLELWNRSYAPSLDDVDAGTITMVDAEPDQAVFRIWLAARLGMNRCGGDATSVLKTLSSLEGKTAADIAAACKQ